MKVIEAGGARIPALGLGTWTLEGATATRMVAASLEAGYRHIDTARMYQNERDVGAGLEAAGVPREEVFLTTKIWPDDFARERFLAAAEDSAERLATVPDLLLLHWPSPAVPVAETIEAAGAAVARGLARHVGVSNFTTRLLAEALEPGVPLACNQIEYHPFLDQTKVIAASRADGLAVMASCPLVRGRCGEAPVLAEIGARLGASPEQVALAWLLAQDGVVAIPRTRNPQRLVENLAAGEIALAAEDIARIDALRATGYRICDFDLAPEWDAA